MRCESCAFLHKTSSNYLSHNINEHPLPSIPLPYSAILFGSRFCWIFPHSVSFSCFTMSWNSISFHCRCAALCVCVFFFVFVFFLIIYIRHRIFHLLGSSELLSFESFASSFSIASSNRVGCWKFSSPFQFFLSIISLVIPYYLFVVLNLVLCVHWSIPVYRCVFGFILVRYTLLQ